MEYKDNVVENREPHLVYRAGMVPYFIEPNGTIQMMFMRPTNSTFGTFTYQLAKGKVEDDDETFYDAALREAKEELGLFTSNIESVDRVGNFMGRTMIFVAKINNKDMFGMPSDETESTRWMTIDEFLAEGRDLHRPVIQAVYKHIQRIEQL